MGCGFEGNKLFWRLREEGFDVTFAVDNKRSDNFWGKHISRLEDVLNCIPYFLISSDKYYEEFKIQLESKGLKEFDDFIKGGAYNRKVTVINANCYGPIYNDMLKSNAEFTLKYYIYDCMPFYAVEERDKSMLENTDVCITQDIKDTERNHLFSEKYIRGMLNEDAKVIVVPNLVGLGKIYYPQYGELNKKSNDAWSATGFFKYSDKIIEEKVELNMTNQEIYNFIQDENVFDKKQIKDYFDEEIERFAKRENGWDVKIIDDIKGLYHETQIFYDPQYPTNLVFELIIKKLLKLLDIHDVNIKSREHLGWDEMPVYPEVAKVLGLNWWTSNIKIRQNSNLKFCNNMELVDYITEYTAWCYERNK